MQLIVGVQGVKTENGKERKKLSFLRLAINEHFHTFAIEKTSKRPEAARTASPTPKRTPMDNIFNNLADGFFGPAPDFAEQKNWEELIEQILAGRVVPVIGPELLCEEGNLHEMIVDSFARQTGVTSHPTTFSQLKYDDTFMLCCMRMCKSKSADKSTDNIIYPFAYDAYRASAYKPSSLLRRLLAIPQLPFVVTTSFTPIVEETMREVRPGAEVRTLTFDNDPCTIMTVGKGDVRGYGDLKVPTVYHMFGCCGPKAKPHSMVLTDSDMLRFCQSWIDETKRPHTLSRLLSNSYLLVLGCNYSDWLFRFIWFSIKGDELKNGGMVSLSKPQDLVDYFTRMGVFIPQSNAAEVVSKIEQMLAEREQDDSQRENFARPKMEMDVFISYSRSDSAIAARLYDYLRSEGLSVWYDRSNLMAGSNFMEEIKKSIKSARVFVPIISQNLINERMDEHVYRKEWNIAIDRESGMGASRNFILPLHEEGTDFYKADIPEAMQRHSSSSYNVGDTSFPALLKGIRAQLAKLKK